MFSRNILTAAIAASMMTVPASRVAADAGDLVGGLVGGIVAGAIISGANKRKPPPKRVYVNTSNSAASVARAANRETQTALNYFNFPAGAPDGVMGRRSRAAVSSMQAYLGSPVTGQLTAFEREILIGAYNRGIAGSYETIQLVSKDPDGARALLIAQRDFMTGGETRRPSVGYAGLPIEVSRAVDEIAESSDPSAEQLLQRAGFIQLADLNGDGNNDYILDTSFSGSTFWCSAVQCKSLVFVSTPNGYRRNDLLAFDPTPASFSCIGGTCTVADTTVMASTTQPEVSNDTTTLASGNTGLGTLPTFGVPTVAVSMASHCSKVALGSGVTGVVTEVSAISNPELVLDQQFCVARQSAMDEETSIIASLNVSQAQVDAQCAVYGEALKPHVAALGNKSRDAIQSDIAQFVSSSGVAADQLYSTAKICLGAGYRVDDMNIALGTGLLLVELGDVPYGELMGHHLRAGVGVSERPDLSMEWYSDALDSLADGAAPVFAAAAPERMTLISSALAMMNGGGQAVLQPIETSTGGAKAKLPTLGNSGKKSR